MPNTADIFTSRSWLLKRATGRLKVTLLLLLTAGTPGAWATTLSVDALARIAPVHEALERVKSAQDKAGPARGTSAKLVRLGELDQAGRNVMQMTDLTTLPAEQRDQASAQVWHEIDAQDAADRAALVRLLPEHGWFTISAYGKPASDAAWSVVQHQTDDPAFMAAMLERMRPAALKGDVEPTNYALLIDRVAMLQHRPQLYGSQFICRDHHWVLYTLQDPESVEARRMALHLPETEAQVEARIATYAPCYFPKQN